MTAVFAGTTEACITHLAKHMKGDAHANRSIIASFTRTTPLTVHHWLRNKRPPAGETLIRLRFYLEFLGYEVSELETLDPSIRAGARIFAFSLIEIREMMDMIGLHSVTASPMLAIIRGASGISREKIVALKTLGEMYHENLLAVQKATPVVDVRGRLATPPPEPAREVVVQVNGSKPLEKEKQAIIESLSGLVLAMLPLAKLAESDAFTAEDRAKIREYSGEDGVFKLANILTRMCGERSRAMHTAAATNSREQGASTHE